jgi:hypothetical protein
MGRLNTRNIAHAALTTAALAAIATISACQKKGAPAAPSSSVAQSSAPAASSAAPAPLTFRESSPQADVALKLPAEIKQEPELHRSLYSAEVRDLKRFAESAKAEFAEEDEPGALPSEKRVDWTIAQETPKLISLRSLTYEFDTGGAHPNFVYGALLWDKSLKKPLALSSLFRSGADLAKVQAALCDGVRTESHQRFGAGTVDESAPACPKLDDTPFQLTPSKKAGKAAGITFLISPYATGAMANAPYQVSVTLPTFVALLSATYADDFGGEPAPPRRDQTPPKFNPDKAP